MYVKILNEILVHRIKDYMKISVGPEQGAELVKELS